MVNAPRYKATVAPRCLFGLEPKNVCGCVMIHGLCVLLFLWLQAEVILTNGFREHSDIGLACTQHPSIHGGAPDNIPDLRTYSHIDSVRSPCQSHSIELDAATGGGLCKITE